MATNSSFRTLTLSNIEGIAEEKNYLKSNFENASTSGWNKFTTTLTSGVPTGSLTVGTAASITFFDAYAVNPLTGKLSLRVNSGNTGWTAGQGIISDVITIDRQDQGKVLNITFDYEPTINPSSINFSGVLGQQTFAIYVYDVTASAWVQPAGFLSMTGNGISTARATFQTAMVAGQQYRVAIVCLQTTPSISVGLVFDNFQMTRSNYIYGTPVTDWQSYTPTFQGFGTVTNIEFQWRRAGDSLEVKGKATIGTATATEARVSFPNGLTAAGTDKIPSLQIAGLGARPVANAETIQVLTEPSVTYFTFCRQEATLTGLTKQNGNAVANAQALSFFARTPIAGWSSSVQTSDSADTRVVAARATKSADQSIVTTATTAVTWNTYTIDTHGGFLGNTYTVPVAGFYKVGITVDAFNITSGASGYINIYIQKNGSNLQGQYYYVSGTGDSIQTNSGLFQFAAGDQITFAVNSPDGNYTLRNTGTFCTIERLSGPSVIAASESVNLQYFNTAGTVIAAASNGIIPFATKQFDSHSAWSGNNTFTAPISGKYLVSCVIIGSGSNVQFGLRVFKNGSQFCYIDGGNPTVNGTNSANGTALVQCNAGDTISIYSLSSGSGGSITLNTTSGLNHINICRVGN